MKIYVALALVRMVAHYRCYFFYLRCGVLSAAFFCANCRFRNSLWNYGRFFDAPDVAVAVFPAGLVAQIHCRSFFVHGQPLRRFVHLHCGFDHFASLDDMKELSSSGCNSWRNDFARSLSIVQGSKITEVSSASWNVLSAGGLFCWQMTRFCR